MKPNYDALCGKIVEQTKKILDIKQNDDVSFPWYPWDSTSNIFHLDSILPTEYDYLFAPPKTFADIGAADGDLALALAECGFATHIYDWPQTNMNGLQGAYYLKNKLRSVTQIFQVDLDSQFRMDYTYETIFFLGILYHLKNPFFVLERLSMSAKFMFLSTRILRTFAEGAPEVSHYSAAYLVGPHESRNDATNFWFFTDAGLRKIMARTGWEILAWSSTGLEASNPHERDERVFVFAKSIYHR